MCISWLLHSTTKILGLCCILFTFPPPSSIYIVRIKDPFKINLACKLSIPFTIEVIYELLLQANYLEAPKIASESPILTYLRRAVRLEASKTQTSPYFRHPQVKQRNLALSPQYFHHIPRYRRSTVYQDENRKTGHQLYSLQGFRAFPIIILTHWKRTLSPGNETIETRTGLQCWNRGMCHTLYVLTHPSH